MAVCSRTAGGFNGPDSAAVAPGIGYWLFERATTMHTGGGETFSKPSASRSPLLRAYKLSLLGRGTGGVRGAGVRLSKSAQPKSATDREVSLTAPSPE